MKKTYLATFLFVVIVSGGTVYGLFFSVPHNTIVLRDDGFHPRSLTISLGETVTFRTARDKYFWPASDLHPTHSLFPSFDPKEPIAPGEEWSFTFDTAGTYTFHDHLAAYYFGVIQVQGVDGVVPPVCEGSKGFTCWQNEVFVALSKRGLTGAFARVRELYATEPEFVKSCHYVTHNIGLASYQLYLENPKSIYSTDATSCASGFYHGFMEGFLGTGTSGREAARICDQIGTVVGSETPDARLQCFHGIGHGAMETAVASTGEFNGIDAVLQDALEYCEDASTGADERCRCASGMYNALANSLISGAYNLSVSNTDPVSLCARQPEIYKESCYGNMNSVLFWAADNTFSKALPDILRIEPAHQRSALKYLINISMVEFLAGTGSVAQLANDCRTLEEPLKSTCISGIVHGLVEHGAPGSEYQKAFDVCRADVWSHEEQELCFSSAYSLLIGTYGAEKRDMICATLEPERQTACRQ